jgi:YgiT-type zinc finger domain-containing protein
MDPERLAVLIEGLRAGRIIVGPHAQRGMRRRAITSSDILDAVAAGEVEVIEAYPYEPRGHCCLVVGWRECRFQETQNMTRETARCPDCGDDMEPGTTTYCDTVADAAVIIENIPALICGQCGYEGWAIDIAAEIERLVRDQPPPTRTVTVPVYELVDGRYQGPSVNGTVGDQRKVG